MTDSFKNECKKSAYKNRLGKVIVGDETFSNSDLLSSIEIVESCISNNNIIGNTTSSTIKFNTLETNDFSDKEASVQIGVKFDNGTTEYIKNGKYTITNQSNGDTVSNGEYKATDDLYKLDVVYVCGIDNVQQATIGDFYIDVCNQIGLVPKSNTFMNSTIKVGGNPFTNNETCRTVLHSIAQASCSFVRLDWDNNKIELAWFDNTYVDTLEKKDYLTLEKNQVFGPVNSLVIKDTYTEGENVTRQDSQSIQENGECQISIEDNYFLYTEDLRTEAITNIWNRIKGFTYINYKLTTNLGKPYWRKGNKVKIQDMNGDYFDSYIINNTFTYDGTFNNTIEAPSLSTTQTAIKNTQESTSTKLRRVERTVNKVNGEIQDIVDEVDEISETTAELDIKVGELSAEVKTVASPVASDEGTGQREVDDLIANKLMYIKVHPTDRDIVGLYASELLKASTNLKPLSRNITFENTNGKCVYYRIPRDLLYRNGIYDEFVQDNIENKCYVIHRVGLREDGTKYKLPDSEVWEEPIVDYDPIMIEDGSYKVYIDTYNSAYIKVKGLIKNDLTSQLVTEIEFSNKMEMTDKQFSVELNKKVDGKDYTGAQIIARINDDESEAVIKADKVNITGFVTFSDLEEEGKTTINGSNIKTGTLDASQVNVTNLNASNITSGTISADKINGGTINGNNVNVTNLNANNITSGTISCDKLSGGTITGQSISGGTISGTSITTSSGNIGGWNITDNSLYNGDGSSRAGIGKNGVHYAFWAGSENSGAAPYRVGHDGSLVASKGNIGGCSITDGVLNVDALNIKSGTINGNRIPDLNASKITSGTLGRPLEYSNGTVKIKIGEDGSTCTNGYRGNSLRWSLAAFTAGGTFQTFDSNGSPAAYFNQTGSHSSSDIRLKDNINEIDQETSMNIINELNPIEYTYKGNEGYHRGLSAQQVVEVLNKNGIKDEIYEINENYYSLNYNELIPDLINCIKSLNTKINDLEKRIDELEGK